jgi:two-component system response regulator DegU
MTASEQQMTARPIRVLIVDDHPLFRDGLQSALGCEEDIVVVGQCSDGENAVQIAAKDRPDVVLLDINLPSINGLQVTKLLRMQSVDTAVVVLTAYHDSEQVIHAMRAGAAAYCPKDITPEALIDVIRAAASGDFVVGSRRMSHAALTAWLQASVEALSGPYANDPNSVFTPLSPREMEILQHVTNGLSNKEIASQLQISQQTVKNHMTSILKKLNVQDRTQAAVAALRHGWVRIHDSREA